MAFEWLERFCQDGLKEPNYAERTLAAYSLGMKAKGSIVGVVVHAARDCCEAARQLPPSRIYHPKEAPHLPLPACPLGNRCGCVYRPMMSYQCPNKRKEEEKD
jgi:hypothetical protein